MLVKWSIEQKFGAQVRSLVHNRPKIVDEIEWHFLLNALCLHLFCLAYKGETDPKGMYSSLSFTHTRTQNIHTHILAHKTHKPCQALSRYYGCKERILTFLFSE